MPDDAALIHSLIDMNEQSARHLESVAEAIEDRGLGQVLHDFAHDCDHFRVQLRELLDARPRGAAGGMDDSDVQAQCEAIDKSIERRDPTHRILAETEFAEERIVEHYEQAIAGASRGDVRHVLREQLEVIREIHDWLHRVRLAAAA